MDLIEHLKAVLQEYQSSPRPYSEEFSTATVLAVAENMKDPAQIKQLGFQLEDGSNGAMRIYKNFN